MIERRNYFDVLAYLEYHERILQSSPKTIKRKWSYLRHLIEWADAEFLQDARKIERTFPRYLLNARNDGKAKSLSPASLQRICLEARRFFQWARLNKSVRYRRVPQSWIDTIRPTRASGMQSELVEREYYTIEEVRKVINLKPIRLIDKRDRAAVAFLFLSGMRISAFVSLPVRCVDMDNRTISQLPSEGVQTKNSKAAKTYLLPIEDLLSVVLEWHELVSTELGQDGMWYPVLNRDGTKWGNLDNPGGFESRRMSFSRSLKRFCSQADIPYRSPHKLRNGHGVFGVKAAKTVEDFKAFSQNMMHESMEITDRLYGRLASDEVKNTIQNLGIDNPNQDDQELFRQFLAYKKWCENQ